MRKMLVLFIMVLLMSGCAGLISGPSVCDDTAESSVLCDISAKAGVRLENVGNVLIIVNAVAIREGLYSRAEALEVLAGLLGFVNDPDVLYTEIRDEVDRTLSKYPELFTVADLYLQGFNMPSVLSAKDRRVLSAWLDGRIRGLK